MRRGLHRRNLLKFGAGLGAAGLAGGVSRRGWAAAPVTIKFMTWSGPAMESAFRAGIAAYQAKNPNVTVEMQLVTNGTYYQQVDTRLAGGAGPDLFHAQYQQIGRYGVDKGVIELSKLLASGYMDDFPEVHRQAVTQNGGIYAVPFDNHTYALYYNADYMDKLGVTPPASIDKAWSWAEFMKIAGTAKEKAVAPYPFCMAWQGGNAYRWMIFLYQHGGRLTDDAIHAPEIDNQAGIETIAFTQKWFTDGLVPPSTSIKSNESSVNLFSNGTIAFLLNGQWQIPFLSENMTKYKFGVTYMIRDKAAASDLGADCLAISRDCKNPEQVADFLQYLAGKEHMKEFCERAGVLPTRASLAQPGALTYPKRPELMQAFLAQTATVPVHLAKTQTAPLFGRMNSKLADQLELAFTSGQAPEATAKNIAADVSAIFGKA
jgi:multiple sugar transport system substrate-binding protein